jgi:predicted metal-dependent phosphoesterase TrpH
MSKVDLHVHTRHSDGVGTVEDVLSAARDRGLLAVAITDHNEIKGALEAVKKSPESNLEVIVGEEISTLGGHVIGLFLKDFIEAGLTPEETVHRIHAQGGLAVIPHPFPHYRGLGRERLENLLGSSERPDAVEVRNGFPPQLAFAQKIQSFNRKSWHLPEVGGSDSHHPKSVGSCYTEFDGEVLDDLRTALKEGRTSAGGPGWTVFEMARATVKDAGLHLHRRFRDR